MSVEWVTEDEVSVHVSVKVNGEVKFDDSDTVILSNVDWIMFWDSEGPADKSVPAPGEIITSEKNEFWRVTEEV